MQVKQSCASLAAVFCLWGKVSDGSTFVRVGPGWRKGDFGLAQPAITALAIAIRLPAQELTTSHGTSAWSCKITDSSRVKIRAQPLLKAQTAKRGNGSSEADGGDECMSAQCNVGHGGNGTGAEDETKLRQGQG